MNSLARTVYEIPIHQIEAGDRLRPVDQAYAVLLAESIEQRGLDNPVQVTEPGTGGVHRLVAGAHRLEAFRLLGRSHIPALVVAGDEITARLIEIDENLMRRELSVLDRGAFLAERKRLHAAIHGRRHGGDRKSRSAIKSNDRANWSARFTDEVAERVGLSERAIQQAIARYAGVDPDVRARIAGTWIADNGAALDALRRLRPDRQDAAITALSNRAGVTLAGDLAGAIRAVTGRVQPEPPGILEKLLMLWRKASAAEMARFREHIREGAP